MKAERDADPHRLPYKESSFAEPAPLTSSPKKRLVRLAEGKLAEAIGMFLGLGLLGFGAAFVGYHHFSEAIKRGLRDLGKVDHIDF